MTIAFIHGGQSFLPEVDQYRHYFEGLGIHTRALPYQSWRRETPVVDVEWIFMGRDTVKPSTAVRIHEYASTSTPPWRKPKDLWKKFTNIKPNYRLFLNNYVRQAFDFRDDIPWGYRDMGLGQLTEHPRDKLFDFVYAGSLEREGISRLFGCFAKDRMKDMTLLVLSRADEALRRKYRSHANIIFKGPVPHAEVSGYLHKCCYGINYVPDVEPYNYQTSTKFLEYQQAGLGVITTEYAWVVQFMAQYGGNYFFLKDDLSNLDPSLISDFRFRSGALEDWTWELQVERSGILDFLQQKFPSQSFRHST
jgi:glycosyltransferase involved in cell wall biosynthesis